MHAGYARLVALVAAMTAVIPGVEAFITDVVDKLRAADAGSEEVDLGALADQLEADKERLSHAIVRNTPSVNTEQVNPDTAAEVDSIVAENNGTSASQIESNISTAGGANTTQDSQLTNTDQVDPAALGDGDGQGVVDTPADDSNGGNSAPAADDSVDQPGNNSDPS